MKSNPCALGRLGAYEGTADRAMFFSTVQIRIQSFCSAKQHLPGKPMQRNTVSVFRYFLEMEK